MHICVFREQEKFRSIVHKLCIVTITRHKGDLSIYLRIGAFLLCRGRNKKSTKKNYFKIIYKERLFYTENKKETNKELNYIASYILSKKMFEAGLISPTIFEKINLANACSFGVAPIVSYSHICK